MSSHEKKSQIWKWVLGGCALLFVVVLALFGTCTYFAYSLIREPIKAAQTTLEHLKDGEVKKAYEETVDKGQLSEEDFSAIVETFQLENLKAIDQGAVGCGSDSISVENDLACVIVRVTNAQDKRISLAFYLTEIDDEWKVRAITDETVCFTSDD